jgi:pyrroloquinoline quinone biosynthesis protein D
MARILSPAELEEELRQVAARRYYHLHPFHRLLSAGRLDRAQVTAWALNRTYYQAMIPVKDALVLSRLADPADRRSWRRRIVEQDGEGEGESGLDRWLRLTDGLGLDRAKVLAFEGVLPATRFAVDAYLQFVRERTPLEAVASSLTELFSATVVSERMSGMLASYDFIARRTLAYFDERLARVNRDADFALAYAKAHAVTAETQALAIAAMRFKCDVLWSQLDALHFAYVDPKLPPPGAWNPDEETR